MPPADPPPLPPTVEAYDKGPPVATFDLAGTQVRFAVPSRYVHWRVATLFTKEPDTIAWIDGFQPGEMLVDIGANVGMYTIWAAVVRSATVYAFEPEAQNYAVLNRNIALNGLDNRVVAYCAALSDTARFDVLSLGNQLVGGGNHTLGADLDPDLRPRGCIFRQGAVAATLDGLVETGTIPLPAHIKIDVDGLEHKVVAGAEWTLSRPGVRSVMIEINEDLAEHRTTAAGLEGRGFVLAARTAHGAGSTNANYLFRRRHPNDETFSS